MSEWMNKVSPSAPHNSLFQSNLWKWLFLLIYRHALIFSFVALSTPSFYPFPYINFLSSRSLMTSLSRNPMVIFFSSSLHCPFSSIHFGLLIHFEIPYAFNVHVTSTSLFSNIFDCFFIFPNRLFFLYTDNNWQNSSKFKPTIKNYICNTVLSSWQTHWNPLLQLPRVCRWLHLYISNLLPSHISN